MLGITAAAADGKMTLGLHHNTSSGAGYQASLEGWARAGVRQVEVANNLLDAFLKTETLAAAKRVLTDNGLTAVSASCGVGGLIEPNPDRAAAFDRLKRRCEMLGTLGLAHTGFGQLARRSCLRRLRLGPLGPLAHLLQLGPQPPEIGGERGHPVGSRLLREGGHILDRLARVACDRGGRLVRLSRRDSA